MAIIKNTQRKNLITINAGEISQFDFRDTKPNVIQIFNTLATTIFVSDLPDVSTTNFDVQIATGGANVWTFPEGVDKLFLYCATAGVVKCVSWEARDVSAQDLYKTQETVITNSTTTSSVTSSDGGIVSIGSKADTFTIDHTASKSVIAIIKGILSKVVSVAGQLPTALTVAGNLKSSINEFGVSLPAGTNVLGKVGIDGSIPAGSAIIGNVGINGSIPSGTNNIGDVDVLTLPSIPAGTNNIGDVDVLTLPATNTPATTSTIYNVTCTNANTEYSQSIPSNCKKVILSFIDGSVADNFRVAYATGKVATPTAPYLKYPQTVEYSSPDVYISSGTIYFASSLAGKVAQIECWT